MMHSTNLFLRGMRGEKRSVRSAVLQFPKEERLPPSFTVKKKKKKAVPLWLHPILFLLLSLSLEANLEKGREEATVKKQQLQVQASEHRHVRAMGPRAKAFSWKEKKNARKKCLLPLSGQECGRLIYGRNVPQQIRPTFKENSPIGYVEYREHGVR